MITNSNRKKDIQLGMSHGTANARLRKSILFSLVKECNRDKCFRCGNVIDSIDDFSIEHKVPWLDSENPVELFFDLDNISFSHLDCNVAHKRTPDRCIEPKHGTLTMYKAYKCRCKSCRDANTEWSHNYDLRTGRR